MCGYTVAMFSLLCLLITPLIELPLSPKKRYQFAFATFYPLTVIKQACDLSINQI